MKRVDSTAAPRRSLGGQRVLVSRMYLIYVAMPHAVTSLGWMVYNRHRSRPTAVALTPSQAKTLAAVLNLASTGHLRPSARRAD